MSCVGCPLGSAHQLVDLLRKESAVAMAVFATSFYNKGKEKVKVMPCGFTRLSSALERRNSAQGKPIADALPV